MHARSSEGSALLCIHYYGVTYDEMMEPMRKIQGLDGALLRLESQEICRVSYACMITTCISSEYLTSRVLTSLTSTDG